MYSATPLATTPFLMSNKMVRRLLNVGLKGFCFLHIFRAFLADSLVPFKLRSVSTSVLSALESPNCSQRSSILSNRSAINSINPRHAETFENGA